MIPHTPHSPSNTNGEAIVRYTSAGSPQIGHVGLSLRTCFSDEKILRGILALRCFRWEQCRTGKNRRHTLNFRERRFSDVRTKSRVGVWPRPHLAYPARRMRFATLGR